MSTHELEVLGRAVLEGNEGAVPEEPGRDWWRQRIVDYVAQRVGEQGHGPVVSERPVAVSTLREAGDASAWIGPPTGPGGRRDRGEELPCPRCGAGPGTECQDLRSAPTGKLIANLRPHPERVRAWRAGNARSTD